MISPGNIKIGKIPNWSLPPGKSCPGSQYCSGIYNGREYDCYALKAYRLHKTVRLAWDGNLNACKRSLKSVDKEIRLYLGNKMPDWFRIHTSGDLYSQKYLDMWLDICRSYKTTKFLAFTKSFHLDFSRKPRNLKIIWSVMPKTPIGTVPRGTRAYAGITHQGTNRVFECPGACDNCMLCWNLKPNEHVRFELH